MRERVARLRFPLLAVGDTWRQSIIVDGYLHLHGGEWDEETELLGTDPRPDGIYDLYASWDADYLYFGWQGPSWGLHGTGYIHLDTQPGGSATAYNRPDLQLPFEADYVLVIGHASNRLLRYTGNGQWETVAASDLPRGARRRRYRGPHRSLHHQRYRARADYRLGDGR